MKVTEAFEQGILNEYYKPFINDTCECGSPLHITRNRKRYYCENPRCIIQLVKMAENMLKKMNVLGLGKARLREIMRGREDTILQLWVNPFVPLGIKNEMEKFCKKPISYRRAIQMLSIPGFNKKAYKLFDGIDSYKQYVEDVQREQSLDLWLFKKLGRTGLEYDFIKKTLILFDKELYGLHYVFNIKEQARVTLRLVISGNPKGYKNKEVYIQHLNEIGGKYFEFELCSAVASVHFIIADTDNPTPKWKRAKKREEEEGRIVLMRSWEYLAYLQNAIKNLEEQEGIENE